LLPSQAKLARLAHPFYHSLARGGEGHLGVGKNVYYTENHLSHVVLALKPFGCMPSSQSDGVQSAVVNRFPEMIFLPIETAGEGEINAHSRVQMALTEAKMKARAHSTSACKRAVSALKIFSHMSKITRNCAAHSTRFPAPKEWRAWRPTSFCTSASE